MPISYDVLLQELNGDEPRTLQSVADHFGVTRERIRQLINAHGLQNAPARRKPDRRQSCPHCEELVDGFYNNAGHLRYPPSHKTCIAEKREAKYWLTIPCPNCQTDIRIRKVLYRLRLKQNKLHFVCCSHSCSSTYRIKNQTDGFGRWAKGRKSTHPYFQGEEN
jgi:hypothetical protein